MANLKQNNKISGAEALATLETPSATRESGSSDNDKKMTEAGMASGAREKLGLISRQLEKEAYLTRMAYIHQGFQADEYSLSLNDVECKVNQKGNLVIKYKWTFLDVEVEHPNASMVRLNEVFVSTWETLAFDDFGGILYFPQVLRDLTTVLGDYITVVNDPEATITQRFINIVNGIKDYIDKNQGCNFKGYISPTSRNGFDSYRVEIRQLD